MTTNTSRTSIGRMIEKRIEALLNGPTEQAQLQANTLAKQQRRVERGQELSALLHKAASYPRSVQEKFKEYLERKTRGLGNGEELSVVSAAEIASLDQVPRLQAEPDEALQVIQELRAQLAKHEASARRPLVNTNAEPHIKKFRLLTAYNAENNETDMEFSFSVANKDLTAMTGIAN